MRYENITILYVEDESGAREILSRFISRFCGELLIAQNGEEGLELYYQHKVNIVISDIKMPKMNGIVMVEAMKKIRPEQLVIYTTAHIDSEYLFRAIELQVDGYIAKPVDLEKLKLRIEKCIKEIESKKALVHLRESEEKFRTIAQIAQMGILIYKEKFIYVNDALCKILGYKREELLNMRPWEIVTEAKQEIFKDISQRRVNGENFSATYSDIELVRKDKTVVICRASANTIEHEGDFAGLGSIVDITDVIKTKERLELLAQAMEQMDEMVRISDKNGVILYANNAIVKHTKYRKSELIGVSNSILKSGKHTKAFYKILWDTILSNKPFKGVLINRKKDGEFYYDEQTITPILDENDEIKYFVSTSKDVTERIKMQEKLTTLATIDTLTGIYNRYKINLKIEDEINRVNRYSGSFALLMFDIDYFKRVNDTYGHDVGDYVLQEFCRLIKSSVRDTDKFGRWGGEEFMLLSPETSEALVLAQKLRLKIQEHIFNEVGKITVSIGVAIYDKQTNKETLLKEVDRALYEAKANGRNRVVLI